MSARLANTSIAVLRFRRQFDVDALTISVSVMAGLAVASGLILLGH